MIIMFGQQINDLCLITEFLLGNNSRSKSFIYCDDKILLYEESYRLGSLSKKPNFLESIYDKAFKRICNETKHHELDYKTEYSIRSYIRDTLSQELKEIEIWKRKQ